MFVPGKPFRLSVMFVGKIEDFPIEELERLARGKHSNLLRKFVNYGQKKFYNIGPSAQFLKTFLSVINEFS